MSSGITTKIQVGYSTNSKDINAFTWCDVIALYTTWQWLYFEKDFPKNVRYIALRFFDMSHEVEVKDFSFQLCYYPPPAYITVSELADKDATLSWEEPDAEYPISGYSYQYKKASDELWSYETSTTVASAVLDNLLPNTDYNFRMKTNYKDGRTSRYIATNFTTDLQLPYDCGFENGWERWSLVGATERTTIATRNHHDGENAFRFSNYGSDHPQYLISPPFSAVTGMRVSFFHLARGVEKSTFEIGYSVTNSTLSEFTWVESVQSQYNEWKKYERVFPVGTKYIALKYSHVDSNNVQDICLDDFIFDEYTGYAPPDQLSVSSLSDQTVTLTWTAPESATGYAYQYRILGEALWSTITTQTGTSVTVGGLQPNTTFDFRVRALYPNDNHSRFETIRVATDNVALTLPFTDSFENGMGGWRLSDHAESTMITQNAAQTGNNGFCIFHSETQSQTLISPLLDCQNSELAVLFYAKNPYSQIRPASFRVGYSTTSRNLSEFTWVTPYICASSNWTQLAGHFPAGTKYFAIMVIQDTGVLYLDDFTFTSAINPAVPQQLAVTDVTATSADISWTGNTETFNLRYRQKPLFFEDFEKGLGQWTVVRNGQGTTNTDWQHGDIYGNNTFSAVSFNYERYDETHNTLYSVDNWLISPKLTLNNTLKFNGLYVSLTSSEFDVLVSTTTKDISAFAKIGSWGSTDDINSDMSLYSCDLSSYNGAEGYIAFRHKNNVSGSWLAIEDVGIFVGDHNWTTKAVSGNHLTVTGLQPLANYEFHVRGTLPYNTSDWTDVAYFATNNDLYLADNADNTEAIAACATSAAEGKTLDVTLQDRTLWKDGKWNTLCLPFTMTAEQVAAQLAPKELKELDLADDGTYTHATGLDGSTLYLNFKNATKITAGVPYIIRWDATTPNYIENPVFEGVTVNAAAPAPVTTTDGKVSFVGSYSPVALTPNDASNLFLGTNNTLFWPNAANNADGKYYVNACRAYFHVDPTATVREFRLNFGDGEASGIENVKLKIENEDGAWYDLQGRKVKDHGTRNSEFRTRNSELHKGLYIHNGRKVVIK
jgi:chitodextrinase